MCRLLAETANKIARRYASRELKMDRARRKAREDYDEEF